jgi:hypothetical protein
MCVQLTNCAPIVHHSQQFCENWEFNGSTFPSDHKALPFPQIDVSVEYRWWQLFNTITVHKNTKWGGGGDNSR